ncbi:hypothetical protein Hanom_Chr05g00473681 [Helianthus anomalus]
MLQMTRVPPAHRHPNDGGMRFEDLVQPNRFRERKSLRFDSRCSDDPFNILIATASCYINLLQVGILEFLNRNHRGG